MEIIHLEKNNFESLIKDKVLVDFYATWCGPCRALAPVLEELESDIKVIKVDVDQFENIAKKYGIMSIPTLILFENGKEIKKSIGLITEEELIKFLS